MFTKESKKEFFQEEKKYNVEELTDDDDVEEFKKYKFVFKNEKNNWEFEKLSIEDGLAKIGNS